MSGYRSVDLRDDLAVIRDALCVLRRTEYEISERAFDALDRIHLNCSPSRGFAAGEQPGAVNRPPGGSVPPAERKGDAAPTGSEGAQRLPPPRPLPRARR